MSAVHIEFVEIGSSPSGRTNRWIVYAKQGGALGEVKWFGRWRCYGFFPLIDTVFERTCLRDIADFCERETNLQRAVRGSAAPARTEGEPT